MPWVALESVVHVMDDMEVSCTGHGGQRRLSCMPFGGVEDFFAPFLYNDLLCKMLILFSHPNLIVILFLLCFPLNYLTDFITVPIVSCCHCEIPPNPNIHVVNCLDIHICRCCNMNSFSCIHASLDLYHGYNLFHNNTNSHNHPSKEYSGGILYKSYLDQTQTFLSN